MRLQVLQVMYDVRLLLLLLLLPTQSRKFMTKIEIHMAAPDPRSLKYLVYAGFRFLLRRFFPIPILECMQFKY